ncbi:MAG: hypothetical protein ACYS74_01450 [Planctomycetota bacterium]|jgi:CheY-like chemotaxis protein
MTPELVKIIPSILWFFLVVILIMLCYRSIRDDLLPRLAGLKAGGLELSFLRDSIDAAFELAAKSPKWNVVVPIDDKEQAIRRARKHLQVFCGSQFLWVDDHPENNLNERKMSHQLKAEIDAAKSTKEVLRILMNGRFDLVISDMAREDEPTAGHKFSEHLLKVEKTTLVILYIGVFQAAKVIPAEAYGIIN